MRLSVSSGVPVPCPLTLGTTEHARPSQGDQDNRFAPIRHAGHKTPPQRPTPTGIHTARGRSARTRRVARQHDRRRSSARGAGRGLARSRAERGPGCGARGAADREGVRARLAAACLTPGCNPAGPAFGYTATPAETRPPTAGLSAGPARPVRLCRNHLIAAWHKGAAVSGAVVGMADATESFCRNGAAARRYRLTSPCEKDHCMTKNDLISTIAAAADCSKALAEAA